MSKQSLGPHEIRIPPFARLAPWVGLALIVLGFVFQANHPLESEWSGMAALIFLIWTAVPGFGLFVDGVFFRFNVGLYKDDGVDDLGRRLALFLAVVNFLIGGALLLANLSWALMPLRAWMQQPSSDTGAGPPLLFSFSFLLFGYPALLIVFCAYFGVRFLQLARGGLRRNDGSVRKSPEPTLKAAPDAAEDAPLPGNLKEQAEAIRKANLARARRR